MVEIDIGSNQLKVIELLKSVERKGVDELLVWLNTTDFYTAPASSKYHLNCKGGLVQHSLCVYEELKYLNDRFELFNDESVILISLMHDLCKVGYYKENRLKSGDISKTKPYVVDDVFPFGHGEKSAFMAGKFIELTDAETLAIRWHMGLYDRSFMMYDDKLKKVCPQAYLLMFADYLATLYSEDTGDKK